MRLPFQTEFIVLIFLVNGVQALSAQEQTKIDTIQLIDVPARIEQVKSEILEISRSTNIDFNIKEISDTLSGFVNFFEIQKQQLDSSILKRMNLAQLATTEREANFVQNQINDWNSILLTRVSQLKSYREKLEIDFETWTLTKSNAIEQEAPEAILESIELISKEIATTQDSVKAQSSLALTIQATLTRINNEINLIKADISSARDLILANLFLPEQPALWNISIDSTSVSFFSHAKTSFDNSFSVVSDYNRKDPSFKYKISGFFLFVLILLLYVKYFNKDWKDSEIEEVRSSQLAIKQPVISTLIVTWLFTILWVKELPSELSRFMELIMLTPLIIILRGLLGKKYYQWLWVLLGFGIFHSLYNLVLDENLLQRFSLLIIIIGSGWAIIKLLLQGSLLNELKRYAWLIKNIMRLSVLICLVAFIANIIGSVLLSELLIMGVIVTFLGGMVFYAAESMVSAILALVLTSPLVKKSNLIRKYKYEILSGVRKILYFVLILVWIYLVLRGYTIQDEVMEWISGFLTFSLSMGSLNISVGNVLAFIITVLLSVWISRFVRFILEEEVFERTSMAKGVPGTITLLARYGIISLGFLLAIAAAGINLSNITIIIGALGVGIGFGLQDIFNNLISGLILAFERPIQVGDVIQVGELRGIVMGIGFRSSTVKAYDGSEVIVPNGQLISNQIQNFTLSDRKRRMAVNIGVAYGTDPVKMLELLSEVAADHEDVLKDPNPRPRFIKFGDSSLDFQLLYWIIEFEDNFKIETEMNVAVDKKLKEAGIQIPFPQRDIHIKSNPEGNFGGPQNTKTD